MQHLAVAEAAFRCAKASVSTLIGRGVNSEALVMCRMMLDDWICQGEGGPRHVCGRQTNQAATAGSPHTVTPPPTLKAPDPNPFSKTWLIFFFLHAQPLSSLPTKNTGQFSEMLATKSSTSVINGVLKVGHTTNYCLLTRRVPVLAPLLCPFSFPFPSVAPCPPSSTPSAVQSLSYYSLLASVQRFQFVDTMKTGRIHYLALHSSHPLRTVSLPPPFLHSYFQQ